MCLAYLVTLTGGKAAPSFTGASKTFCWFSVSPRRIGLVVLASAPWGGCAFSRQFLVYPHVNPPKLVATGPVVWYHPRMESSPGQITQNE